MIEKGDTIGERIRRIWQMETDFLFQCSNFQAKIKKSVSIRRIRPIRSPIVSLFSKAKIAHYES